MMRPEIRYIENDNCEQWRDFSQPPLFEIANGSQHFTVEIGVAGQSGGDLFQTMFATSQALAALFQATRERHTRVFLVDQIDAPTVLQELQAFVAKCEGESWLQIAEKLCEKMSWEYENYSGPRFDGK